MGKKILGLDIAPGVVKYGLVKNGGHPRLLACGSLPVFSDLGGEYGLPETELDVSAVVLTVKEALARSRDLARVDGVSVCLGGGQTVVRPMTLPALPEHELAAAVEYELAQSFPGLAKTHSISFRTYTRTKKEIRGVAAFTPKKGMEVYRRLLEQLGYRYAYVDAAANAAAKAWQAFSAGKGREVTLLCELGESSSRFTVVRGEQVLHSRQVAEGVGPLSRPLQVGRGGSGRPEYDEPDSARRAPYGGVLEQLLQTVEFYNQNAGRENAVSQVALTGIGAEYPELSGHFSSALGLPVLLAGPPAGAAVDMSAFSMAFLAVGAAVREDL